MHILGTILIGFVVGAIAKFVMPGKGPGGFIITILLGIGGALIATHLGQLLDWYQAGQSAGFIGAIMGAILILFIYRSIGKRDR